MSRFKTDIKLLCLVTVCLLTLSAGGCRKNGDYGLRFNHFLHVEDNGLACADCHGESINGSYGLPGHKECADCHSELVEAEEIGKETCGFCHTAKDLNRIALQPKEGKRDRRVFYHSDKLNNLCGTCHGGVLAESAKGLRRMSRRDVILIREQAHASGRDCAACHQGLSPELKPASHEKKWRKRHGMFADDPDFTCNVCHPQETCRECHQSESPASHNNLWRLQTHGLEGSWDRQRCRTCHQDDFCTSCHRETKPRSHNGMWVQRHCLPCHESQAPASGCRVCHEEGLDAHDSLTIPHNPQPLNCLFCHNAGIEPQQIDFSVHPFMDETECLNCHHY